MKPSKEVAEEIADLVIQKVSGDIYFSFKEEFVPDLIPIIERERRNVRDQCAQTVYNAMKQLDGTNELVIVNRALREIRELYHETSARSGGGDTKNDELAYQRLHS